MGLIGYALFTLTFGFSTSLILGMYDMQTISLAFSATAGIMIVFGAAGIMFPQFFQRIQGVLITALIALFVVQLILMFLGVGQTFIDLAVIVIFCGSSATTCFAHRRRSPRFRMRCGTPSTSTWTFLTCSFACSRSLAAGIRLLAPHVPS